MLSIQSLLEPSKKHVLEQKLDKRRQSQASGDPPNPSSEGVV
jgi:hypothetical protein